MNEIPKRVLVTGAGRCGTSAFMKFLHGYINDELLFNERQHCFTVNEEKIMGNTTKFWNPFFNAGLEYVIDEFSPDKVIFDSPYIFKDPRLCSGLRLILEKKRIKIDHLFILIRDYRKSALSRQKNQMWFTKWKSLACEDEKKSMLENQIEFNERSIGRLMETVAIYDVPHTIIQFPRFAKDSKYLQNKLKGTPLEIPDELMDDAFSIFDEKQINF